MASSFGIQSVARSRIIRLFSLVVSCSKVSEIFKCGARVSSSIFFVCNIFLQSWIHVSDSFFYTSIICIISIDEHYLLDQKHLKMSQIAFTWPRILNICQVNLKWLVSTWDVFLYLDTTCLMSGISSHLKANLFFQMLLLHYAYLIQTVAFWAYHEKRITVLGPCICNSYIHTTSGRINCKLQYQIWM